MYYFYVLKSEKDLKYYYGSTTDLKNRFNDHNQGKVLSTKFRRPLRVIYFEAYETISQARQREQQVKYSGSIRKQLHNRLTIKPDEGPARPPEGKPGQ